MMKSVFPIFHLSSFTLPSQEASQSLGYSVEGVSTSRSSQTSPTSHESEIAQVPESPPPPYVTPPGTILRNLDIARLSESGKTHHGSNKINH